MAVLVTGGAGYIGSHTCVELLESGKEIVVVDNFCNSKPEALKEIKALTGKSFRFYEKDLLNRDSLDKIFKEQEIDSVIHFAGLKAVGESVDIPLKYYHNNITGTLNLLEVMQEYDCKKIVFSSSATVYGDSQDVPFKEDAPIFSTNPYGRTKVMIEEILKDLYVSDPKWSIVLLRYFNPIGAHHSGRLGEDPQGIPNNLLPYISKVAIGELPFLQVYGSDYDTPDGTGVRDYLHVVDLAIGHIKALSYADNHMGVEAINLGTGVGYSVLDVLHAYEKAVGKKLEYKILPRRAGDIAVCYADPNKAKNLLGWRATMDLAEMCHDSWNFISNSQK